MCFLSPCDFAFLCGFAGNEPCLTQSRKGRKGSAKLGVRSTRPEHSRSAAITLAINVSIVSMNVAIGRNSAANCRDHRYGFDHFLRETRISSLGSAIYSSADLVSLDALYVLFVCKYDLFIVSQRLLTRTAGPDTVHDTVNCSFGRRKLPKTAPCSTPNCFGLSLWV